MDLNYQQHLPANFHDSSRVWIYQSSRVFGMGEVFELEKILSSFTESWNSHGAKVKGYANLFFGQFILLMADETTAGVSGCSTDSSVRVIKQIEEQFNVSLFDRQQLAFVVKDRVQLLPLSQFGYALENGFVNPDTLYFNNLVATKKALQEEWIIPVKDSWLKSRLPSDQLT